MTITNALRVIRSMGLTATYNAVVREYRIDYRTHDTRYRRDDNGRTSYGTSYHTDDQQDAIATARWMQAQKEVAA